MQTSLYFIFLHRKRSARLFLRESGASAADVKNAQAK